MRSQRGGELTHIEILKAMAESDTLADQVLAYLNHGMQDEWDCTLPRGLEIGFGGPELRIAAKTGYSLAEYHENNSRTFEQPKEG